MTLTSKQKAFISEYTVDHNAAAACRRAGYSIRNSDSRGAQLLTIPEIAEAIEAREAQIAEEHKVTISEIIQCLRREADGQGKDTNTFARIRATVELAKISGLYVPKEKREISRMPTTYKVQFDSSLDELENVWNARFGDSDDDIEE